MRTLFARRNAFNIIFFLSFIIMAIFKSSTSIERISSLLSVFMLALATLKTIINTLESAIDSYDSLIKEQEDYFGRYEDDIFNAYRVYSLVIGCSYKDSITILKDFIYPERYVEKEFLKLTFYLKNIRILRTVRRIFLSLYYSVLCVLLIVLLLMEEIPDQVALFVSYNFTLWSLAIVLFQVLLSDTISDFLSDRIFFKNENKMEDILIEKYGDPELE